MKKNTKKKTRLKDIADACNVSLTTVSRIMHNDQTIFCSEETRKFVYNTAKNMDYKQSFCDKLTRGESTRSIAILLGERNIINREMPHLLIDNLMLKLNEYGYVVSLNVLKNDLQKDEILIRELINRGNEHFIFIGGINCVTLSNIIYEHKCTCIGYECLGLDRNVSTDTASGIRETLRFFLDNGLEDFKAVINPGERRRLTALCDTFPDLKVKEIMERYVVTLPETPVNYSFEERSNAGYDATAQLFTAYPQTRAIFYHSDHYLLGGVRYLVENNHKIGKDIIIAGVNNDYAVRINPFPIIEIEHKKDEILSLLLNEFANTEPLNVSIKPRLIIPDEIKKQIKLPDNIS